MAPSVHTGCSGRLPRGAHLLGYAKAFEKSFQSQLQNERRSKASVRPQFASVFWAEAAVKLLPNS